MIVTGWHQDLDHPAAGDRHLLASGPARVLWGMAVTAGPGPLEITVAPGQALLRFIGDTANEDGAVLITNDAPLVWEVSENEPQWFGFFAFAGAESVGGGDITGIETEAGVVTLASVDATTTVTAGDVTDGRKVAPWNMIRSGPELPSASNGVPDAPAGTMFVVTGSA